MSKYCYTEVKKLQLLFVFQNVFKGFIFIKLLELKSRIACFRPAGKSYSNIQKLLKSDNIKFSL